MDNNTDQVDMDALRKELIAKTSEISFRSNAISQKAKLDIEKIKSASSVDIITDEEIKSFTNPSLSAQKDI